MILMSIKNENEIIEWHVVNRRQKLIFSLLKKESKTQHEGRGKCKTNQKKYVRPIRHRTILKKTFILPSSIPDVKIQNLQCFTQVFFKNRINLQLTSKHDYNHLCLNLHNQMSHHTLLKHKVFKGRNNSSNCAIYGHLQAILTVFAIL